MKILLRINFFDNIIGSITRKIVRKSEVSQSLILKRNDSFSLSGVLDLLIILWRKPNEGLEKGIEVLINIFE